MDRCGTWAEVRGSMEGGGGGGRWDEGSSQGIIAPGIHTSMGPVLLTDHGTALASLIVFITEYSTNTTASIAH